MENNIINNDIELTRENAKAEFEKENYSIAKQILKTLWDNSSKDDEYLLYEYGKVLRKEKEGNTFIEICRELNKDDRILSNSWIKSILCWCLYDCCIKNYTIEDNDSFDEFIKRAEYIKDNCSQGDVDQNFINPYILTIQKVVKIFNERASKNFKEIIKWLSYLIPDKLSEEEFKFKDKTGKERELASPKEFYYQHLAKAFEKTKDYESCIRTCEKALNEIKKFHYRNETWIKARMYYSRCMVEEDIENAISDYKKLADKENFWFMYHKLSQICFRYNKIQVALLYASKAYSNRFEYEKMVNLLIDTAFLWQATGNDSNARLFFQGSAYYRKQHGWHFSEELEYAVSNYKLDVDKKPDISKIQNICNDYIESIEGKKDRFEGKIIKILSHGGSGFIKPEHGSTNIYFNMKDVKGKITLRNSDIVEYELSEIKNGKCRAVKIVKRS